MAPTTPNTLAGIALDRCQGDRAAALLALDAARRSVWRARRSTPRVVIHIEATACSCEWCPTCVGY